MIVSHAVGEWLKSLPRLFTVSSVRNTIGLLIGILALARLFDAYIVISEPQALIRIIPIGLLVYVLLRSAMYAVLLGFAGQQQPQSLAFIKLPTAKKAIVYQWYSFLYVLPRLLAYIILPLLVSYAVYIHSLPRVVLMLALACTLASIIYGALRIMFAYSAACATPYEELSYKTIASHVRHVVRLAGYGYLAGVLVVQVVIGLLRLGVMSAYLMLLTAPNLGVGVAILVGFIIYALAYLLSGLSFHWYAFSYSYALGNE